jgi:hypothetical protein
VIRVITQQNKETRAQESDLQLNVIQLNYKTILNELICYSTERRTYWKLSYNLPATQEIFGLYKFKSFITLLTKVWN